MEGFREERSLDCLHLIKDMYKGVTPLVSIQEGNVQNLPSITSMYQGSSLSLYGFTFFSWF